MGKLINLQGQKFGRLTVLQRVKINGKGKWKCQCECGNIVYTQGNKLTSGNTKSCGCLKYKNMPKDLTGKKFGRLQVLSLAGTDRKQNTIWHCRCECGKYTDVVRYDLTSGHTQSCGCLQKERTSQACRISDKSLENKKFGKLTVLSNVKISNTGHGTLRECKCECGNIIYVHTSDLISGHTQSCGCQNQSRGEEKIEKILLENNIPFEKEKTFSSCKFPDTQALARFDFYVDNKYLIEYDGIQHFQTGTGIFDSEEKFQKIQKRDSFKTHWCKENNIPLIRIPYTKYENLTIKDLLLN